MLRQVGFSPMSLITPDHFCISDRKKFWKPAGGPPVNGREVILAGAILVSSALARCGGAPTPHGRSATMF